MDRRSWFFLGATLVILLTIPVAPSDLRWVPAWLAVVYAVLTLVCVADHRSRRRTPPAHKDFTRSGP
jgi:hypothetical protein